MLEINVEDAGGKLNNLLDKVKRGEEIIIIRDGKKAARLVPTDSDEYLPSLKSFRASIQTSGKPLSRIVIENRNEDRI